MANSKRLLKRSLPPALKEPQGRHQQRAQTPEHTQDLLQEQPVQQGCSPHQRPASYPGITVELQQPFSQSTLSSVRKSALSFLAPLGDKWLSSTERAQSCLHEVKELAQDHKELRARLEQMLLLWMVSFLLQQADNGVYPSQDGGRIHAWCWCAASITQPTNSVYSTTSTTAHGH